jgi:hypothetical protein
VSAAKAKGTAWETAVVNTLRDYLSHRVERRTLSGSKDRGDIAGLPDVVIECKNAAKVDLAGWLDEANTERRNADAMVGAVWFKRRGKSSPRDGYVLLDGDTFMFLLREAGLS